MPTSRCPTLPPTSQEVLEFTFLSRRAAPPQGEAHSTTSGPFLTPPETLLLSPAPLPAAAWLSGQPLSQVRLPGHRLGDGPRAHWHLDPLLPLLSPGIRQHVVLVRVQLVGVMELHGSDQVCSKHLDRERKGSLTLGICILLQSTGSCRVTMVLPCNQVTVSTENQSDLLRKALGLPHPGPCSGQERQQLSTLTRLWLCKKAVSAPAAKTQEPQCPPGKLLRDSQFSKQAAEDNAPKNPWKETFHSRASSW